MSWDLLLIDLPASATSLDELPKDLRPPPLGARAALIERFRSAFPDASFKDPSWGLLDGGAFSIEFNLGRAEVCETVMLHVRGGGAALDAVDRAVSVLGCRAVDCQTGELFRRDEAERSFGRWAAFRDAAVQARPKP